ELLHDAIDHRFDLIAFGDVRFDGNRARLVALDRELGGVAILGAIGAIVHCDERALVRESFGDAGADAAARACDEGNLVLQAHATFPARLGWFCGRERAPPARKLPYQSENAVAFTGGPETYRSPGEFDRRRRVPRHS